MGLGSAAAWPLATQAQQRPLPVIGYLNGNSEEYVAKNGGLAPFRRGLGEQGYLEGRDVEILYRYGEYRNDRLPELAAADLVRRRVAVIFCNTTPASLAAKKATATIPIVFWVGSDPVQAGLVASLNRPGGNLTGVSYLNAEVAPKRLELLHEFIPAAKSIALLVNPADPVAAEKQAKELEAAVRTLGLHLPLVKASNAIEIEDAFSALVRDGVEALQIGVDPLFANHTDQLVALATRHKVPTIYPWREFTAAGGLMNYGASIPDAYHQVGIYTGQILKGAKPSDLAVQRPTKLRFVLNLKAAKALGITFPLTLLARADEVIQ